MADRARREGPPSAASVVRTKPPSAGRGACGRPADGRRTWQDLGPDGEDSGRTRAGFFPDGAGRRTWADAASRTGRGRGGTKSRTLADGGLFYGGQRTPNFLFSHLKIWQTQAGRAQFRPGRPADARVRPVRHGRAGRRSRTLADATYGRGGGRGPDPDGFPGLLRTPRTPAGRGRRTRRRTPPDAGRTRGGRVSGRQDAA